MNIERELLWYKSSSSTPERHYWSFLVINEEREIEQIRQKLKDQLEPVVAEKSIDKQEILGHPGFFYDLFTLESTSPRIDFSKVYRGKIRWDRRLQPRKANVNWSDLIDQARQGYV